MDDARRRHPAAARLRGVLPLPLQAVAEAQAGAFTAAQARRTGFLVAPHVRAGRLTVVRKQVYAATDLIAGMSQPARLALHASARILVTRGDLVASHATAAGIHGFALLGPAPVEPQLTEPHPGGSTCRRRGIHVAELPAQDRTASGGVAVTAAARTVADCGRVLPPVDAVVTADSALRLGVARATVLDVLDRCRGWPGSRAARTVLDFADARSDSPLESATRWLLAEQGVAAPDLQVTICDADGRDVGDVDFVWLAHRTILETDGRVKYDGDGSALWREKLREDRLRTLGFEVVRGYWSDLGDGGAALAERVRAAFALNAARTGLPAFCYRYRPERARQRAA